MDLDSFYKNIEYQKKNGIRPKPSNTLISIGKIPPKHYRKYLVDICAELVDEDEYGRSDLCLFFAVLLKEALCFLGFNAEVHSGQATYFSKSKNNSFTWDHKWVVYDDNIIDGNIDSCIENPRFPKSIKPKPFWGPINLCPDDIILKTEKILDNQNNMELDEEDKEVINYWIKKLKLKLKIKKDTLIRPN